MIDKEKYIAVVEKDEYSIEYISSDDYVELFRRVLWQAQVNGRWYNEVITIIDNNKSVISSYQSLRYANSSKAKIDDIQDYVAMSFIADFGYSQKSFKIARFTYHQKNELNGRPFIITNIKYYDKLF